MSPRPLSSLLLAAALRVTSGVTHRSILDSVAQSTKVDRSNLFIAEDATEVDWSGKRSSERRARRKAARRGTSRRRSAVMLQGNRVEPDEYPEVEQWQRLPPVANQTEEERSLYRNEIMCLMKASTAEVAEQSIRQRSLRHLEGDSLPRVNGTCSVVSSSGVLLLHQHGEAIDRADKVFRFNTAPVKTFEMYVGSRSDIDFVNEKVLQEWLNGFDTDVLNKSTIISASCTLCHLGTDDRVTPEMFMRRVLDMTVKHPFIDVYASDLGIENVLLQILSQIYHIESSPAGVTTGSVGMTMALTLCDEVRAYGFADTPNSYISPYHYYDADSSSVSTESHHISFDAEKDLWARLATNSYADLIESDIAVIPGFSHVQCPEEGAMQAGDLGVN